MTNTSFNTDPNELTSFDGGYSPPESQGTLFKFILDFVRPAPADVPGPAVAAPSGTSSRDVSKEPSPEGTQPPGSLSPNVRKVTPFESMFNKRAAMSPAAKPESPYHYKRYWMPDDQCKECYECGNAFSFTRRRHHCRLCGQIFCYDCCSDVISGKIAGYGDAEVNLRVCKYCLQQSKHQKLERKRSNTNRALVFSSVASPTLDSEPDSPNFIDPFNEYLQEELKDEDVQKINQHFMWSLFRSPDSALQSQPAWHRLRYFSEAYQKDDVISWLSQHLSKGDDPTAMLESWVETNRLESVNPAKTTFKVGAKDDYNENTVILYEQLQKEPEKHSTNWIHRMIQEAKSNSQGFDVHIAGSVSSFVHVDTDKDLDEEYWQSSEATLNTSQSLDDTIGMEIGKHIDSMNFTAKMIVKSDSQMLFDPTLTTEEFGIEIFNQCIRQEKFPNPSLNIPPFGEIPELDLNTQSLEHHLTSIRNIYEDHMENLLDVLIDKENISTTWRPILRRLVGEAAADVSPNPMAGDSMDIRKYVKFKKLYGLPEESCCVDGYVLTKTVAHKKMRGNIISPKIMLLNGSISYQRVLNKLTSLNPVFLQEKEFLTKVVDRVASFEPDILIVEKSVSQIAKDELLNKGITLILNLKQGQIEKIARNVKGDIIQNLENVTFISGFEMSEESAHDKLGSCREFSAKFTKSFYGSNKPLLFFKGCDKNLTKTILLHGENKIILKKVKKVASYYLYALYNRRLEFNYLKRCHLYWRNPRGNTRSSSQVSEAPTFTGYNHHLAPGSLPSEHHLKPSLDGSELCLGSSPSASPSMFDSFDLAPDDVSEDGSLPEPLVSNQLNKLFEEIVNSTIFSVTPFCKPIIPYLCTDQGNTCPTRSYFDDQIYYSTMLLSPEEAYLHDPLRNVECQPNGHSYSPGKVTPAKPIVTSSTSDDMAFFRAFGFWEFEKEDRKQSTESDPGMECYPEAPCHIQNRFESKMKGKDIDCFDFYYHQKLFVLFSSLSTKSLNHPHPCISTTSLDMTYYGKNDLTLGLFLRDYCYQSSYKCPANNTCKADIVDHERRFVHNGQCVNLNMTKLPSVLEGVANTPLMWSVCSKCRHFSQISIVSKETWNFSFAKFLELKLYENCLYVRAGTCPHSYHRHHSNFFALGNVVACFTRTDVRILEVCPLLTRYNFSDKFTDMAVSNGVLLNETITKINTTLKTVHDKIDSVTGLEEHIIKETKARISAEENTFKQKISEISSDVTASPIDIRRGVYRIQSELVFCVDQWNKYLAVIKRNPKPSPASTTPVSASPKPINASTELISGTTETGTSSPRSPPEDQDPLKKHRRVRSDGSITGMRNNVTRSLSENARQGLHRSMDDILSTKTSTKDSESKSSHSKSSDLKHAESRYSKLTSSTKKFLKSLTESAYKKIECPFPLEEHHRITGGSRPTVLVNEKHFTSIYAYALSSEQYRAKLQLLKPPDPSASNPTLRKQYQHTRSVVHEVEDKSWLTTLSSGSGDSSGEKSAGQPGAPQSHRRQKSADCSGDLSVINKLSHVDVEFYDGPTKFYCKVYFAAEFDRLRKLLMPGEAINDFIHSLAYCCRWRAKGGKSGLSFNKTLDDRWVIKELSRHELQALLMFMPSYIEYVIDSINGKRPSLLAKIIGACTVEFNNATTGASMRQDVIIMENIFYSATPTAVYDLKGSVRNRLAEDSDEVLLDENYLNHIVNSPVFLRPHSRTFLSEAVNYDSAFLDSQMIIDYSLLVGMCDDKIVVGIIDYIRKFTFDKKVEMFVKTNMIGSAGRMPTIVSPERYRERFCSQIDRYFPLVPDKWTGMGSDLHYS